MVRFPRVRRPPEWGVEPVPAHVRELRAFDLFVLWSSLGVGLLVLAAGTLLIGVPIPGEKPLGFGLTLWESVWVALAGSAVGSLMLAAAAHHGSRAGVPTMVSLRPILGRHGSFAPTALNVLQLLGWAAFELLVMGLAMAVLTGNALGPATAAVFVPVFGAVAAALALGGPLAVVREWLRKFAIWLVYASTVLIAVALAIRGVDWSARPIAENFTGTGSLLLAFDLVVVMPISWWPLVSDYNRFARSARDSVVGTTLGYTVANTLFYVLGAGLMVFGLALSPLQSDFLAVIGLIGFGAFSFVPLLFILVDETDNAFANIYSTAVSLQNVAPKRRQLWFILAATVIATAGAWVLLAQGQGIGGGYELFLLLIGGLFVPLLGTVIADAFLVRRLAYRDAEFRREASRVRWPAFASWAAGALLYFAIAYGLIQGFPPIGATLPSFLLAAFLQVVFARAAAFLSGARRPVPGGGVP